MYDIPVEDMNFKQLRSEVAYLRDEVSRLKRELDDGLSNLTYDNFESRIVKEKDNLKAIVKLTADKLLSVLTKEQVSSLLESKIEQTASEISLGVKTALKDYETSENAEKRYDNFYSQLNMNSEQIQMTVSKMFSNIVDCESVPRDSEKDTDKIYHYTSDGIEHYVYYDNTAKSWFETEGNSLFSSYTQTADGFALKGDFVTTTNAGATVKIKGTKLEIFAGENADIPKLSMGFDEMSHGNIPLILLGTGDGSVDDNGSDSIEIDGSMAYYGQGVIQKDTQQFIIKLMTPSGTPPGLYITKNSDGKTLLEFQADNVKCGNEIIATRNWVKDNCISDDGKVVAVFG